MAIWYIANNLWTSSEEPVDLGLVDGVQAYRVQSLMSAYNNCVAGDTLTLDPDSPNFRDNKGYRLKTVVFGMEANWVVAKSITLSGGVYRLRLDGGGARNARLTDVTFKDVDFCRLYDSTTDCIVVHNVCRFERCQFIGCDGAWSTIYFNSDSSSVLADCAFYGNKTNIRSNVPSATPRKIIFERCILYCSYSSTFVSYIDSINLYGLTQEQVNVIGFIKPPKAGVHLDTDETSPTYNKYIYEDGTEWTNTDWESVDLRLKLDSEYATGNSLTESDGEVLDLDGVPRKPGGAKGAYEVAKSVIYFNTDGWDGTGALSWLGVTKTLWGEYPTYLCSTVDQAINAAPYDGIVSPDPDSASFRDAAGLRLHTVTVPLGANFPISKSITLAGGAYRLRIDGGGTFNFANFIVQGQRLTIEDVDIIGVNSLFARLNPASSRVVTVRRCLIAGSVFGAASYGRFEAYDTAFIANRNQYTVGGHSAYSRVYKRCVTELVATSDAGLTYVDSINVANLTQEQLNAVGFVAPPKSRATNNTGYYTDGTEWTINDWESVDLRLLSTSEYVTGNALTSASGDVFDLAGNKRKPGGAKGAYEVLDDVTHTATEYIPGYYTVDAPEGAPKLVFMEFSRNESTFRTYIRFQDTRKKTLQWRTSGNWITQSSDFAGSIWFTIGKIYEARVWYNDAPDAVTYIKTYASELAPSDARDFKSTFIDPFSWGDSSSASTPGATSVCYLPYNAAFADTSSTVKKIIVPGWTYVVLGDLTAEVVLGLGATVKTSGNLTLVGETLTSEELFEKIKLVAPAEFTLKDCTVSD